MVDSNLGSTSLKYLCLSLDYAWKLVVLTWLPPRSLEEHARKTKQVYVPVSIGG